MSVGIPPSSLGVSDGADVSPLALNERAWVEVNLPNLVENARTIRSQAAGASLLVVAKADAYGLGASAVAEALRLVAPWGYAVATLDEGVRLRGSGVDGPILVLMPARWETRRIYVRANLRAVIEDPDLAAVWALPFHVEIDTGMGRCGIRWHDSEAIRAIAAQRPEGVFTHFHSADEHPATVETQWSRFQEALGFLGYGPPLVHAANSAGTWRLGRSLDLIRPGIFLYGGRPANDLPPPRPVVAVRTRVISLRSIRRGETVSYGADWMAESDTRIATLGIGYADGVPRAVQDRASVIIANRRYPIVGRVTMDMIMVDVGPEARTPVRLGDVATVLGSHGPETISLDEFADWAGTSSYEVLTGLSPRLPRYHVHA